MDTALTTATTVRIRDILTAIRPLAAEYYRLTGKPLGVTGEIAEAAAADLLGLELAPARTAGYDAIRHHPDGRKEHIQIKGRAFGEQSKPGQRLGMLKRDAVCDTVMVVLLDNATLDPQEIWEAPYSLVIDRLARPGSKARERGALGVREFKRMAACVWSAPHV
ncbi:hypothetical protein SAMN05892877_14119 [Rhizobium subbaraonis]|uniref:DUF6998 domain-containing protein n=1 Tax=Rhizobium subbaraonis TaxID=908946 RepID=A0A285V1Y3_9HYPH|nr:hypothetical protein [Rhizobium subbaraonis]SOC48175.1 hypothetical protein SAMN05892877_14119 [Rhizobium subbaraonis]